MTMALQFLSWYLAATIIGWLVFPLAFRLLPKLSDRGYAFTRVLGLLLWGFIFWILASLQILHNNLSGYLLSLSILITLSIFVLQSSCDTWETLKTWLTEHKSYILTVELLFFGTFALWAFVRAANPEAIGTEKPMELAFINAILHSPTFPPHDPWLSGYAISYYYFGYVIVSMLAKLTGVSGGVAFNLGISLTFALTAISTYGLVYNFLATHEKSSKLHDERPTSSYTISALLGPLFILIVSNLEGFLHTLHNRGLFWSQSASGELYSNFWTWLDIKDLNIPPVEPYSWIPHKFWWWWRASRVLQDYDLMNNAKEIIDEFPFFSYLLADLHPHVLAMPFLLLSIGLALNLAVGGSEGKITRFQARVKFKYLIIAATISVLSGFVMLVIGLSQHKEKVGLLGLGLFIISIIVLYYYFRTSLFNEGDNHQLTNNQKVTLGTTLYIAPGFFLLSSISSGAMAFLNTWDFPVSVGILAGAYAIRNIFTGRQHPRHFWKDFLWAGILFGITGIVLYLPFYLGFSSQAGGFIPNPIYITRGAHLWVMFAPLLLPIFIYLITLLKTASLTTNISEPLKKGAVWVLKIFIPLLLLTLVTSLAAALLPGVGDLFLSIMGATNRSSMLTAALSRRILTPGAWITLVSLLVLVFGIFWLLFRQEETFNTNSNATTTQFRFTPSIALILSLILFATLLVFIPEFFYLRDLFGWRINTIFKFYFQAWILWSITAAYAFVILWHSKTNPLTLIIKSVLVIILIMSLFYPLLSTFSKTNNFHPSEWTLDSTAFFQRDNPVEMRAINWLNNAPFGTIVEAVPANGGSYTPYARVSTLSGLPSVLGWVGHESQWRGGHDEIGSRQDDIALLYCSHDWKETLNILNTYHIKYIYIGSLERTTYIPTPGFCPKGLYEIKFQQMLPKVFNEDGITIYEYQEK